MKIEDNKISPYQILGKWFYDGDSRSNIPPDVLKDKSINHMYLLNFFQYSEYIVIISKLFNNWDLFSMDREDVFRLMKDCIVKTGYKQPFIKRGKKSNDKLANVLKFRYPFLKKEELNMIVSFIDESDDKDSIYEMFGFYNSKKKKVTKEERNSMIKKEQEIKQKNESLDDLMENFK